MNIFPNNIVILLKRKIPKKFGELTSTPIVFGENVFQFSGTIRNSRAL